MKLRTTVLASLVLGACATTTKTPPSPAQPPAATLAASAATHAAAAAVPAAPDTQLARWAKSQGYRATTVGQRLVWCKTETTVASRIARQTCVTDANLSLLRQVNEQNQQTLLNSTANCPLSGCAPPGK